MSRLKWTPSTMHLERLHDHGADAGVPREGPAGQRHQDGRGRRARPRSGDRVHPLEEQLPKGVEFARYVKCLAAARGNRWEALEMAKANYPQHPRIATVLKAAVAAGTTTDATWAGPFVEYQTLTSEFIDYLRPQTIIGKFGTGGVPRAQLGAVQRADPGADEPWRRLLGG